MSKKTSSKIIFCRAPVRLDFGGPTDVQPFPQHEDGFVVNATIGLYAKVKLEIYNKSKEIALYSEDYKTIEKFDDINCLDLFGSTALIKAVIKYINPQFGFKLTTAVDVPPGSGLGSSAALAVALLRVFNYYRDGEFYNLEKLVGDALYVELVTYHRAMCLLVFH